MIKLIILFFSLSSFCHADEVSKEDFKIKFYGKNYFLQKKSKDLKLYKLERGSANQRVIKIINKEQARNLFFVVYLDSFAGTSTTATFYRAVVWDNKKKLFIGDVPYETVINEGGPTQSKEMAKWIFKDGTIEVYQENEKVKELSY